VGGHFSVGQATVGGRQQLTDIFDGCFCQLKLIKTRRCALKFPLGNYHNQLVTVQIIFTTNAYGTASKSRWRFAFDQFHLIVITVHVLSVTNFSVGLLTTLSNALIRRVQDGTTNVGLLYKPSPNLSARLK